MSESESEKMERHTKGMSTIKKKEFNTKANNFNINAEVSSNEKGKGAYCDLIDRRKKDLSEDYRGAAR